MIAVVGRIHSHTAPASRRTTPAISHRKRIACLYIIIKHHTNTPMAVIPGRTICN